MKTSSLFLLASSLFLASCGERVSNATNDASLPDIYPDYVDVTIPVGIAPLNFGMKSDDALLVDAVITDDQGNTLTLRNSNYADFRSITLPTGKVDIIGMLGSYSSNTWQLYLRTIDDVKPAE